MLLEMLRGEVNRGNWGVAVEGRFCRRCGGRKLRTEKLAEMVKGESKNL